MAKKAYKGKNLRATVAGGSIFHSTDCTFSTSKSLESIATKDTDGEEVIDSNYSWTMSINSLVANTETGSSQKSTKDILDAYQAGTSVAVEFTTNIVDDFIITGNALIESCEIASPVNGAATFTVSLRGNGNFTTATVTE